MTLRTAHRIALPAQPAPARAQYHARGAGLRTPSGDIRTFHVQGNVYLLVGAGGNIAVQTGDEGVLVVDTGLRAARGQGAGRDPEAVRQADPLHHQHAVRSRSRRRQRSSSARPGARPKAARPTIIANENVLTPDERVRGGKPSPDRRCVADVSVLPRGEGHLLQRRADHAVPRHERPHRRRLRSSSSAGRMWSSRATSS